MKVLITTLNSKYIHSSLAVKYIYQSIKNFCNASWSEYTINENIEKIYGDIISGDYDLVGFSCYIWNIEQILKLTSNLKKASPNTKILLGGPEVSYDPIMQMLASPWIDYILSGEGEESSVSLINQLNKNHLNLDLINGLTYRSNVVSLRLDSEIKKTNNSYIIKNGEPVIINNLESIPYPYENIKLTEIQNKIIYYETSRGCIYNCSYCLSSTTKGIRYFPLDNVKKDIIKLIKENVPQIKLVDRTFNADKKRTLELIKFFKEIDNGLINFHFEITAHLLEDDIIFELQTSRPGLFQLEIGIQSTNPKTITAVSRVDNFPKLKKVVELLKQNNNIHLHLDLIAGLPYEDLVSFQNSFNEVYALQPQMLQLGFLKMLKGSPIRNQSSHFGYNFRNYPPYEIISNMFINASEMIHLKNIEEAVEIYHNKSHFMYSIKYLYMTFYQQNGYYLFEDLSIEIQKFSKDKNPSRDDYYYILMKFFEENNWTEKDFFRDLLKFDFFRMGRNKKIPHFLVNENAKISQEKTEIFLDSFDLRLQFKMENLHRKEIIKKVHVELFSFDIIEYIAEEKIKQKQTLIAFDYSGRKDIFQKVDYIGGENE